LYNTPYSPILQNQDKNSDIDKNGQQWRRWLRGYGVILEQGFLSGSKDTDTSLVWPLPTTAVRHGCESICTESSKLA
jgi:hypothetical protein